MNIFLGNFPLETKKYEIANLINGVLNECLVDNKSRYDRTRYDRSSAHIPIDAIEILSIQDVNSNTLEKHGLARVFPEEVGKRVIKRLEGTSFKQNPLTVREYVFRSGQNERRNTNSTTEIDFEERRTTERRRITLMKS